MTLDTVKPGEGGVIEAVYGEGALRRIDDKSMEELRSIFEVTGGRAFFDHIEECSERKAREMGYPSADDDYFNHVYTANSGEHH